MNSETNLPSLLIVDDDPLIREGLALTFAQRFKVYQADSRPAAIALLRNLGESPQLALVDLGLPPLPHRPDEGFDLIVELLAHAPAIRIFVLSGQSDLGNAKHARALGAVDFITKPCPPDKIADLLLHSLQFSAQRDDEAPWGIVGKSSRVQALRDQIRMYANIPYPVLIEGESGTGKELVANGIRLACSRPQGSYKALNCAAIPPTLIEPTLFGYSKGAFTGANSAQSGFFEEADGGTLFLDEIGELPLEMQTKLLRVLENGEYQRVGETMTRTSKARIIAATNRNLREAVRTGNFRADLYHRLCVFPIAVPPLRDLGEDRLELLSYFSKHFSKQTGNPPFALEPEALALWNSYDFPGNTRELRNIVIRLTTKFPGQTVSRNQLKEELDPELTSLEIPPREMPAQESAQPESGIPDPALLLRLRSGRFNLDQHLREQEAALIQAALDISAGNVSEAARLLGINRTTLHSRLGVHEKLKT